MKAIESISGMIDFDISEFEPWKWYTPITGIFQLIDMFPKLSFQVKISGTANDDGVEPTISSEKITLLGVHQSGINLSISDFGYKLVYGINADDWQIFSSKITSNGNAKTLTNIYRIDLRIEWEYSPIVTDNAGFMPFQTIYLQLQHTLTSFAE